MLLFNPISEFVSLFLRSMRREHVHLLKSAEVTEPGILTGSRSETLLTYGAAILPLRVHERNVVLSNASVAHILSRGGEVVVQFILGRVRAG